MKKLTPSLCKLAVIQELKALYPTIAFNIIEGVLGDSVTIRQVNDLPLASHLQAIRNKYQCKYNAAPNQVSYIYISK